MRKWIIVALCSMLVSGVSMAWAKGGESAQQAAEGYVFQLFQGNVAHAVNSFTLDAKANPEKARSIIENWGPLYQNHFQMCGGIDTLGSEIIADGDRAVALRLAVTFKRPSGDPVLCRPNFIMVNLIREREKWFVAF